MRAGTVQTILYVCEVYDMVGVTFTNVGVFFILLFILFFSSRLGIKFWRCESLKQRHESPTPILPESQHLTVLKKCLKIH